MRTSRLISIVMIFLGTSCVDRLYFDTGLINNFPIVIDGSVTTDPGPYEIRITKSYDIESKQSFKTPISVRQITLYDNQGNLEVLKEVETGVYQTNKNGIQGQVGRAYQIRIDLFDDRVYESIPDTLKAPATIDSVYFIFKEVKNTTGGSTYGFNVFFNAHAQPRSYYLWDFKATYQIETNPEEHKVGCPGGRCPDPRPCSGVILQFGGLYRLRPCECCTCWIDFFNETPRLNDAQLSDNGIYKNINVGYVPMNQWTFMHKVHAEVRIRSLSRQSYEFWKAVQNQKEAIGSLFQPVSGKIAGNFKQIAGKDGPIEGIFYATSKQTKAVFIRRSDVPNPIKIPEVELHFEDDCRTFAPYARLEKPDFWEN